MKLLVLILALSLTGCASSDGYQRYLSAQSAAIKAQKPMLEIIAQKDQPITGLASIRVYGPGMSIQQERPNEWAAVVSSGINVLGVVGGIAAAGQASRQLADSVGTASGQGYQYVQAPGGIVTTTTTSTVNTDNSVTGSYNPIARTDNSTVDNARTTTDNTQIVNSYNPIDQTSVPTVVTAPAPVIVEQPAPVIVVQPEPIVVLP